MIETRTGGDRLVSVTPEIKAHRLWDGSQLQLVFIYGSGITRYMVKKYIRQLQFCDDLTPSEKSWIALWEKALNEQE